MLVSVKKQVSELIYQRVLLFSERLVSAGVIKIFVIITFLGGLYEKSWFFFD